MIIMDSMKDNTVELEILALMFIKTDLALQSKTNIAEVLVVQLYAGNHHTYIHTYMIIICTLFAIA